MVTSLSEFSRSQHSSGSRHCQFPGSSLCAPFALPLSSSIEENHLTHFCFNNFLYLLYGTDFNSVVSFGGFCIVRGMILVYFISCYLNIKRRAHPFNCVSLFLILYYCVQMYHNISTLLLLCFWNVSSFWLFKAMFILLFINMSPERFLLKKEKYVNLHLNTNSYVPIISSYVFL